MENGELNSSVVLSDLLSTKVVWQAVGSWGNGCHANDYAADPCASSSADFEFLFPRLGYTITRIIAVSGIAEKRYGS